MNRLLRTIALSGTAALSIALSSCVVPVEGLSYDPGAYPPGNSYGGVNQDAYRTGYRSGREDALAGKSEKVSRHEHRYDRTTKEQFREGYQRGYENYTHHNSHTPPTGGGNYRADVGQGQITIRQGGRVVSVIRTASPNIEQWHFKKGQERIVTKSRGNHGPATVELFETRTGVLRDKVLAYAIKNGKPEWARGMQD